MNGSRLLIAGAGVAAVLTAVLSAIALVLAAGAAERSPDDVGAALYEGIVYTVIAGIGAAVNTRQPRNAVGWVLQMIALTLALNAVGNQIYDRALATDGDVTGFASYATWSISWLWIFAIVPAFTVFPLVFPSGRVQSPRWQVVLWVALLAGVVMWFGTAFIPGPIDGYPAVVNPFGIDMPWVEVSGWVGFGVLVPTALASITSVILRFRHSTGVERQQLKWVASAAAFLPVSFVISGPNDNRLGFLILLTGLALVAVTVGIAMLRYRLYDIDVVINRTLVYGALTAILAASYLGSVLLLQFAIQPLTASSDIAVAASTLAVAAMFRPARRRIQGWVDLRFYRNRYDAARTVASFTEGLRDQVDVQALAGQLLDTARNTVHPTHASLWLRRG